MALDLCRLSTALLLVATALSPVPEPARAAAPTVSPPTGAAMDTAVASRMDDYALERMAANGTSGLAYAVVGPDGVEHRGLFGTDGHGSPVTGQTPFLWGSVAKPVAATAALTLVEDGRLDLDVPVSAYLAEFDGARVDPAVRELLTQTSGITEATQLAVTDRYGPGSADVRERVTEVADAAPGTPGQHEYSSANYLVLGAVIAEVTGTDYPSYLRSAVLEPAGMDRTVTGAEDARDLGLAPGQRTLWGLPAPVAPHVDDGGAAYGYLGGDIEALSAFAELQLSPDPAVLDADMLAEARTGTAPLSSGSYGLGWREVPVSGLEEPVVWHGGSSPGYVAIVVLLPERERAVVLQQNTYDHLRDGEIQAVGFGLAHLLTGGDSPTEPGADPMRLAVVWGSAAATLLAGAGVVVGIGDLRRGYARRRWSAGLWSGFGVAAVAGALWLALGPGTRQALLVVPDVAVAVLVAGGFGALTLLLRLAPWAHRLQLVPVRDRLPVDNRP